MCAMMPKLRSSSIGWARGMGVSFSFSSCSYAVPLPAVVRERAVGFRHSVRVFAFLDGVPPVIGCIEQLSREPVGHRLFAALARSRDDPANAKRLAAHGANFDRHLIGGAADAAGTH